MNKQVTYYPRGKVEEAVAEFQTPFFLYEEARLRENCRRFKSAFEKYFVNFWPLFAVKANPNPEILKIIKEEGYGFDVSSAAETWIVSKIGGEGMHTGNYLPREELVEAAQSGLIMNLDDVSMLGDWVPDTLSFRINPGIGGGSMESLIVAGPDAKYGVPFEKAAEAYQKAKDLGVKNFGIHMMAGSNVLDEEHFGRVVERLCEVIKGLPVEIDFMNIGGGFGVPYKPEEKSLDLDKVARLVREAVDKSGIKEPRLMAEPGRLISADMGWLVSKVVCLKDGYKKFVGIDASSNDMPRPAIYGAYHHVTVLGDAPEEVVSVVGSICENNDQFAKDRLLPHCEVGDIVLIHNCGGHAYAMGHNYNGKLRHAEILLEESGKLRIIRRAETIEDLFKTTEL